MGLVAVRCEFKHDGDSCVCVRCGRRMAKSEFDCSKHHATCHSNAVYLGDMVAAATSAIGIKPCGKCDQRRRKLNDLDRSVRRLFQR